MRRGAGRLDDGGWPREGHGHWRTEETRDMRHIQRAVPTLLAGMLALTVLAGRPIGANGAGETEPFISEYVEGPSATFAKAVEIYNPTTGPINLANYLIEVYVNGSTTPTTIPLTGTLAAGDVFVVANPSSVAAVLAVTDQQTAALNFNGNDMVVLRLGTSGAFIDAIGQIAVDPGAAGWGSAPLNTTDSVLQRKPSITVGDATPTDAFDPAAEWDPFPNTDFSGLGTHSVDGDGSSSGTVSADVTMAAAAACLELSATSISFGTLGFGAENAPATPSVTLTNCATVNGSLLASATDAAGTTASWNLVDSAATCADSLGTDAYRLNLQSASFAGPISLANASKSVQSLAAGAATTHTAHMYTACPGSSGDGETLTFQINYLATE